MNYNLILGISFGLSVLFLFFAVGLWILLHKKDLRNGKVAVAGRIITPFRVFLILFFISVACAVYSLNHFDIVSSNGDIVKAVFASFVGSCRAFFMAGDYAWASKLLNSCEGLSYALSIAYLTYLAIIYIVAPVFTLSFILSFFRDISSTIRYALSWRSDLYVMSELNERSLTLAKDITEKYRQAKKRVLIVFTDVFSHGEERIEELIAGAKRIGAVCMKSDITDVGLHLRKGRINKLYFIGENEDENIQQALTLINHHAGRKTDTNKLEFYVFSNTVESEALLTSLYSQEGNGTKRIPNAMKIRRVNENRHLALQEMLEHPIFISAKGADPKKIGIVIVGLGGYGTELLKAICWCSQMPGYSLCLHVFEKEKEKGEEKIKAIAPELIAFNHSKKPFDAQYDIEFHYRNVECSDFLDDIKNLKGITRVYVSLGDDEKNIEIAMSIRSALGKEANSEDTLPDIYPIVYSDSKTETVGHNCELKYMDKGTGIFLIGGLKDRYTLKSIERSELEEDALLLHQRYQPGEAGELTFNRYEYYRNSSIARAVYRRLRDKYCAVRRMNENSEQAKQNNDILLDYDHRRWNTYMRADGFVYAEIDDSDKILKRHPNLVSFNELPDYEKRKEDF